MAILMVSKLLWFYDQSILVRMVQCNGTCLIKILQPKKCIAAGVFVVSSAGNQKQVKSDIQIM